MEPDTFPALRRECACGCEYITIILYEPPFVDAEPKCPCCGKGEEKDAPKDRPQEFICDHAGVNGCDPSCGHRKRHELDAWCKALNCPYVNATVRCIPVADGNDKS